MLRPDQLIIELLGDVGGLSGDWADWQRHYFRPGEPPEPGQVCIELCPLLKQRMDAGRVNEVGEVFANLEVALPNADTDATAMVLWQIIESLQNALMQEATESACGSAKLTRLAYQAAAQPYLQLMGPNTQRAWHAVEDYWKGEPAAAKALLDRRAP